MRVWSDVFAFASARSSEWYCDQVPRSFHPNDYIYQSWAYETHDVDATPGMRGDYAKALRSIKAKR